MLLQLPAVQNYAGEKVANIVSRKLGTTIELKRIDLGLFNRIIIDGLKIYDQQGCEMLDAARISAKIELLPLADGRISISSAQIFGTRINLYQKTEKEAHNFQFVLDSLASKDSNDGTPLDLRVNSLIIRHCSASYNRLFVPETSGKLNLAHININNISAHILLKALTSDSLNVNVKKIALEEQSGLDIEKMSMKLEAGKHGCKLQDFIVKMQKSEIRIDSIGIGYRTEDRKIAENSLNIKGYLDKLYIHSHDIAFIQPALKDIDNDFMLKAQIEGRGNTLFINNLEAESNGSFIGALLNERSGYMSNIGAVKLNANGRINYRNMMSGRCNLRTDAGNMDIAFQCDSAHNIKGSISTDSINIGTIINDKTLGTTSLIAKIDGKTGKGNQNIGINGNIAHINYNSYRYRDIVFATTLTDNQAKAEITSNDPNAQFDFKGEMINLPTKRFVVSTNIHNFNPLATNISNKWGATVLSGSINADVTGSTLESMRGYATIENLSFVSQSKTLNLKQMAIDSKAIGKEQVLTLNSDFAKVRVSGKYSIATLANSILNNVTKKITTLPGVAKHIPPTSNSIQLYGEINNAEWLATMLNLPLELLKPATVVGKIDDKGNELYANCIMPEFSYNGTKYNNAYVAITSPDSTLNYELGVIKNNNNGSQTEININGKASDNRLACSLHIANNSDKPFEGKLNTETLFSNNDGIPTAHINLLPSTLDMNKESWNISTAKITYRKDKLTVDDFKIYNDNQSITASGIASKSNEDSLVVALKNVDVEYILDLVNFRSVHFSGKASGNAVAKAPFGKLEGKAKITVDNFKFQRGRMGVLNADVVWDNINKKINIDALADDGPEALTYVNGFITPSPGYIDLDIKAAGTHLDFMQSFTGSFTNYAKGHVEGTVKLFGPLKTVNLEGDLIVNGETHIAPLNCKYYLVNDTIRCRPDEIEIVPSSIYDIHGNQGTLSGYLHHKHLTKLTYDIFVNANKLLVYDFKDFGKEVFYGTVFGSGNVSIHGRSKELIMNVDVTPEDNSVFVYNVSTPDAILDQKFITWNNKMSTEAIYRSDNSHKELANISSDTYINFKINTTPKANIKFLMDSKTNDHISLHGSGVLNASYYNKGGFNMFGTYTVEDGTYSMTIQDIIKKNFTFKEGGTLVFSGNPENANLNLQAVHTVNSVSLSDLNVGSSYSDNSTRVNCLLNITGKPFDLQLDFGLELPTASSDQERNIRSIIQGEDGMKQQVIYLLGFGRFMPQSNNNETAQDGKKMSQTTQAMQGLLSGTISTQINNVLKSAINNDNWNFGANISTGDEGWNNAEYEGLLNGRLLNNRLLINGQFGYRDNAKTANSSFIGDFDIRYLLVPNGNIALKVYNQTNDRYFTKSSLNTQGIGIIMKKDFTNLNDLLGIKRKPKVLKDIKITE